MLTPAKVFKKSLISIILIASTFFVFSLASSANAAHPLVLETDFGLQDGAVSSMKGVIYQVDPKLSVNDLTHDVSPQNIWEGAYRLVQTAQYWPAGTVFVIVVDPGVGTERKSIVAKSKTGQYFVTPDNGTLTFIAETAGIDSVRIINEKVNRLPGSERSYTFHGRDVYAYTGARLASGKISFDGVGPAMTGDIVKLPHSAAKVEGNDIVGAIPILDIRYGNVWTDIPAKLLDAHHLKLGKKYLVKIYHQNKLVYDNEVPYLNTFGGVRVGKELLYINSLDNLSLAINQGSFAARYHIVPDQHWRIEVDIPKEK